MPKSLTKKAARKPVFKLYTAQEMRQLIDKIADEEGFSAEKLTKKFTKITSEDIEIMLQDLTAIALLGQETLTQFPLQPSTIEQLIAPVNIPFCNQSSLRALKKTLNKQPIPLQLIILLHNQTMKAEIRGWFKIAFYLTLMMKRLDKTTYYKNIANRFKLPFLRILYPVHSWLWDDLPNISCDNDLRFDALITLFHKLSQTVEAPPKSKDPDKAKRQKRNQVHHLALYLELISGKKNRKTVARAIKQSQTTETGSFNGRPPAYSLPTFVNTSQDNGKPTVRLTEPIFEDTALQHHEPFDSDNTLQNIKVTTFSAIKPSDLTEPMMLEEMMDNLEPAIVSSEQSTEKLLENSAPLQIKSLTLAQHRISAKEQHLITSPSTLTPASYRAIFTCFVLDADMYPKNRSQVGKKIDDNLDTAKTLTKNCASIFLLSMLTAAPVNWLAEPNRLTESQLFEFGTRHASLKFTLGITRPKYVYRQRKYENQYDVIRLPLPYQLVNYLVTLEVMPTPDELQVYLSQVRKELGLTYLSKQRVESSLQIILKNYIKGCNSHVAELISRVPLNQAPALYYSSHTNEELVAFYKQAIVWLNQDNHFQTDYIKKREDFTTGSGFALKLDYVRQILEATQTWVKKAENRFDLFNRYSVYTWLIFCLLTGVRPNNAITHIHDIDLTVGWLVIDDKPNHQLKSHRLIPLCDSLIRHLTYYQSFLSEFRHWHIHQPIIAEKIEILLFELERANDKAEHHLINFIEENANKLQSIKRGYVATMLEPIIELSPYWTRHFVRTQLEKRQVPMAIINEMIGHERYLQEAIGEYSSISKAQIRQYAKTFNQIAIDLGLDDSEPFARHIQQTLRALRS